MLIFVFKTYFSETLAAMARNIQMLLAKFDISLSVIHVMGKDNIIADVLSRWAITPDIYKVHEVVYNPQWVTVSPELLHVNFCI